jgi:hypothetical protein
MMIAGCAQSVDKQAVDVAPLRCPAPAARDVAALKQTPMPPPSGDMDKAKAQAWIDGLGGQVRQMNKAGNRLIWQYERCRSGDGSAG